MCINIATYVRITESMLVRQLSSSSLNANCPRTGISDILLSNSLRGSNNSMCSCAAMIQSSSVVVATWLAAVVVTYEMPRRKSSHRQLLGSQQPWRWPLSGYRIFATLLRMSCCVVRLQWGILQQFHVPTNRQLHWQASPSKLLFSCRRCAGCARLALLSLVKLRVKLMRMPSSVLVVAVFGYPRCQLDRVHLDIRSSSSCQQYGDSPRVLFTCKV